MKKLEQLSGNVLVQGLRELGNEDRGDLEMTMEDVLLALELYLGLIVRKNENFVTEGGPQYNALNNFCAGHVENFP